MSLRTASGIDFSLKSRAGGLPPRVRWPKCANPACGPGARPAPRAASIVPSFFPTRRAHGGAACTCRRKGSRPYAPRLPMADALNSCFRNAALRWCGRRAKAGSTEVINGHPRTRSDWTVCKACLQKQQKIDRLEEDLRRVKAKLRYQERTAKEGPFGFPPRRPKCR